ncbi:uncharacterized protein HD556DRAFT_115415 [Suillus plorans]|uniref:Uncharacterized protein n=1 Tax=Suillus plorans TaxID=116603 RepID=A0A9P7D9T9_9AGAM|nr:uncharacterized protein HD556DRAFT_115415 [Suillus plorans]KAG1785520.1 hypothetical protein HD556DRAFT_115415 [Suillus plorans]
MYRMIGRYCEIRFVGAFLIWLLRLAINKVPSYVYVALVLFTDATATGGCPSHLVIACLASSVLLFGRYERCPLSNVPVRDLLHGRILDVLPGCKVYECLRKAWPVLLSERC